MQNHPKIHIQFLHLAVRVDPKSFRVIGEHAKPPNAHRKNGFRVIVEDGSRPTRMQCDTTNNAKFMRRNHQRQLEAHGRHAEACANVQQRLGDTSRAKKVVAGGHAAGKQNSTFVSATWSTKNKENTDSVCKTSLAQFAAFLLNQLADAHGQFAAQTIDIMCAIDGRHDPLHPGGKGLAGFRPWSPWQCQALLVLDPRHCCLMEHQIKKRAWLHRSVIAIECVKAMAL